jgi:sterol desaturase/sphingolipid hydroxylase (fatty acid hydroxylase superfamily)
VHKYLLHVKPRPGFDPWFARVHREHHRAPTDVELALLPPRILRAAIPLNVGLWLLLAPKRIALTGIAASSFMALFYEWCHFLVHTNYKPRYAWFTRVRKNHRLHHFYNENYWFGFTSTLVDTLLHTDPDTRDIARSNTARDLHGLSAEEGPLPRPAVQPRP